MLQLKFILELPKLLGLKTEKLIGELLWSFVYTINLCFRLPVEKDQIWFNHLTHLMKTLWTKTTCLFPMAVFL